MNEQNSIVTGIATELMPAENIESEIVQKFHRFYGEYYMKPERLNVIAKTVRQNNQHLHNSIQRIKKYNEADLDMSKVSSS